MQIIYSHFIAQSRQLTVNGTDYEILAFKVYETFEEARLNINPKGSYDKIAITTK